MRVALISLAATPLTVGGRPLAERQLAFARAAGCEKVILVADGASPAVIALTQRAELSGMVALTVAGARGLLGSVRAADELLVLAPGLLPDTPAALELLAGPPAALVLPAAVAAGAGFERIDLERAWAGALSLPGALVERLAELEPDVDVPPALLRIALQAGLRERPLPEAVLADGSWAMVTPDTAAASERAWLSRHLPSRLEAAPSERLATWALRTAHARVLAAREAGQVQAIVLGALLAGGAALAWAGWTAAGFALVAAGAAVEAFGRRMGRAQREPFDTRSASRDRLTGWAVDAAVLASGAGAVAGSWPHKLFAPLVLILGLRILAPNEGRVERVLTDRLVIGLALTFAAAVDIAEPAIMLLGVILLTSSVAKSGAWRG